MRLLRRSRPSPALVVASIALLAALAGTGVAAVQLAAPNSVGSAQVIDGSLQKADLEAGVLAAAGKRGPAGTPGPGGEAGPQGEKGHKGEKGDKGDPCTRIWARVAASGQILIQGGNLLSVDAAGTGFWNLRYNRSVSQCAVIVTTDDVAFATASPYSSPDTQILVRTYDIVTRNGKAVGLDIAVFC